MIEKGVGVYPTGGCLFMKTGEKSVEWLRGVENPLEYLEVELDDIGFLDEEEDMGDWGISTFDLMDMDRSGWMYNLDFMIPVSEEEEEEENWLLDEEEVNWF